MATQIRGIFDSHAHYFDRRFEAETGGADAILSQIMPDPVAHIVNVGTNPENSAEAVKQAARYAGMFAAVGIHPEDCHYLPDEQLAMDRLQALLGTPESRRRDKIVALGEIGLDYHYENYGETPLDRASFIEMLEEGGLINVRTEAGKHYLLVSELPNVERYSRMYYDLSINMEGIDAIHHLLEKMEDMRREMSSLRKQLLLYREREIEDMDW